MASEKSMSPCGCAIWVSAVARGVPDQPPTELTFCDHDGSAWPEQQEEGFERAE
jgi:hypothetical protein